MQATKFLASLATRFLITCHCYALWISKLKVACMSCMRLGTFFIFFNQLILRKSVRKTSTICLPTPHCFALIDSNIGGGVRSDIKSLWSYEETKKSNSSFDNYLTFRRAEDGAQTRDPQLGRLMLYQLSYFRIFLSVWAKMDSNHRSRKTADLQSAPFGHSGICPFAFENYLKSLFE